MIPKPITAPFRWLTKHPWKTFWAIILLAPLLVVDEFRSTNLSNDLLNFVKVSCSLVLPT